MMRLALALHLLGVVIWIGGMGFAQLALRPAVAVLAPPQRLLLLQAVLGRFLPLAGVAVVVVVITGAYLVAAAGNLGAMPWWVHAMIGIGILMVLIYAVIAAGPYRRLRLSVAEEQWDIAGAAMRQIRLLISINLVLGIAVIVLAAAGRGA